MFVSLFGILIDAGPNAREDRRADTGEVSHGGYSDRQSGDVRGDLTPQRALEAPPASFSPSEDGLLLNASIIQTTWKTMPSMIARAIWNRSWDRSMPIKDALEKRFWPA